MRILVIGGTGFIGARLVQRLLLSSHEVVVVARGITQPTWTPQISRRPTVINVSRKDICKFKKFFNNEKFDVIYDLAGFSPRDVILVGETFPYSLRYIFVSTAAVYGTTDSLAITEQTPVAPLSWHDYGRNKWLCEEEIPKYPQLDRVIVRPLVIYGPGDPHEPRASYFFTRIFHQIPLIIPGRAEVYNNYLYVDDLAELLHLCLQAPSHALIHAGGPEIFDWPSYLQTAANAMRLPLPPCRFLGMTLAQMREWPYCRDLQFHHNAFHNFVLSSQGARETLGWQAKYSLSAGLMATWEWLRDRCRNELAQAKTNLEWETLLWDDIQKSE